MPRDLFSSAILRFVCATASAILFWYGTGLHPVWWLTWFAPLPVLYAAARSKPSAAFFVALGALAAGGLNMWQYLFGMIGVPMGIAVLADLGPALIFAIAVTVWRAFTRRGKLFEAALAFAAIWVCYELAQQRISVHSTFGNFAYTQMDFLPVVQIAALAGVAGISFLLFCIPGAVAACFSGWGTRHDRTILIGVTAGLAVLALGWGELRLQRKVSGPTVTVGLISSDAHENLRPRDAGQIQIAFEGYAAEAENLIRQGAQVIVLPEKNAVVSGNTVALLDQIIAAAAKHGAVVATGVERWTESATLNEIRFYSPDGKLQATYEKHHMLPPFESNLLAGNSLTTVNEPSGTWGLEICKDMDFPALSRQYGNAGIGLLIVSAWDFDSDGWYHDRMAILRGVESGFSIARAAKEGVLTVSDDRGRVLAERPSNSARFASLLAVVPVHHDETLYDRWGDWFGWLNVVTLVGVIASLWIRRNVA